MYQIILMALLSTAFAGDLKVVIEDKKSTEGQIFYSLFNSRKGFPDRPEKSFRKGKFSAQDESLLIQDLSPGTYALTLAHDQNSNGKLDSGVFGIPKEPFGFSQNPKILFGPPDFEDCSFEVTSNKEIKIKMKEF